MRASLAWLLPALAASFVSGIVLTEHAASQGSIDLASLRFGWHFGLAGALLAAWGARRSPGWVAAWVLFAGFGLGGQEIGVRLAAARSQAPEASVDATVAGRVCAREARTTHVFVELCDVSGVKFGDRPPAARVPDRAQLIESTQTPEGAWLAALAAGDRVRARLRFDALSVDRNPGARNRAREAARSGLGAQARLLDARLAVRLEPVPGSLAQRWHRARGVLGARLSEAGPGGPLLAALALGDRRGLSAEDRDAFRQLGISHLLAVSGLHLALVGALAFWGARTLLLRCGSLAGRVDLRLVAAFAAAGAGLGYALLTGFGVPVRRAWLFVLAAVAVLAVRRSPAPAQVLAGGALLVALADPAAVFDLGAQLSFAATGGLLLAAGAASSASPSRGVMVSLARAISSSLRISATAIAVTAPILAAHGVSSTPAGLVANGVAVPVTGFVLLPVSLVAAAAAAWGNPGDLVLDVCEALAHGAMVVVHGAADVGSALGKAAGFPLEPPSPGPSPVAILVLGCVALAGVRCRSTWARVGICLTVCAGLLWSPVWSRAWIPVERTGPLPPRVVAFAVGQGDSILVEGRQATLLVDGGWASGDIDLGRSIVAPALRALGVERIDLLVASHADADHRGGLVSIVEAFEVGEIWLPHPVSGSAGEDFPELSARARAHGIPVFDRGAGDPAWQRGDLRVEVLWPPRGNEPGPAWSRNEASLVLRASVGGHRVLLTGDIGSRAEVALLRSGADLRAEILKVAHHGSRRSSTRPFLEAVGFDVALLSAPCGSRRRLPAPEALARLADAGGSTWWTGRDGAVLSALGGSIESGGGPLQNPSQNPLRGEIPTRTWGWSSEPRCRTP